MIARFFSLRRFHLIAALIIAASILVVYSNSFNAAFQYDDNPQIVDNDSLKDLKNIPALLKGPRGITLATFAINYAIGGTDVFGYHVVNTAIHILASIAVYFFVFQTILLVKGCETASRRVGFFSAMIFALHPVQTQAVTYIVQRMEALSALFYLLALIFFIRGAKATTSGGRWVSYTLVAVSFILGFYSKESAFTLPAVILLYDFCFLAKGRLSGMLGRWPVYAVLAALFIFFAVNTIMPLGGFGDLSSESAVNEVSESAVKGAAPIVTPKEASAGFKVTYITPREYLFTQFNVHLYYMALLAVPMYQNLDYDIPRAEGLFTAPQVNPGTKLLIPMPPPIVSLVILAAVVGIALYLIRRTQSNPSSLWRAIGFFALWNFIILSPTSSFIPIIDVIYEHRLYLPSLGFFVAFVLIADRLLGKRAGVLRRAVK
ncbi:MAG: hypothetical protein A2X99_00650 [Deltaproteobacteria bacterium GWB2_55_19]|nr:MAG: hypothetical protein A2X99_00650 [Deltaproteobacteria bacterium GWB2_55_19]HAO93131.1 hypothetical protein [Deltaproteobacteria bacterium]